MAQLSLSDPFLKEWVKEIKGIIDRRTDGTYHEADDEHFENKVHNNLSASKPKRARGGCWSLFTCSKNDPNRAYASENTPFPAEKATKKARHGKIETENLQEPEEQKHPAILKNAKKDLKNLRESTGKKIDVTFSKNMENWGRTIKKHLYALTYPITIEGARAIVNWAIHYKTKIRVAGYRHTWSNYYPDKNHVLISILSEYTVSHLPHQSPPYDIESQFNDQISQFRGVEVINDTGLARIGPGLTNGEFLRWSLNKKGGREKWTVPFNVIMEENTIGGVVNSICHGAGFHSSTMADLVRKVTFINARGAIQEESDPYILKALAGCFGLMGVAVEYHMQLDRMTYANMTPRKIDAQKAIPNLRGGRLPPSWKRIKENERLMAEREFEEQARNSYYAEWFWFPYRKRCWVNVWNNDGRRDDPDFVKIFPTRSSERMQKMMEYLAEIANKSGMKLLTAKARSTLLGKLAMSALPNNQRIVTPLINGIHFRRGIQNMRVWDMEFEIPIPPKRGPNGNNVPDFSIVQKAWWMGINCFYDRGDSPIDIALEVRITGPSEILMATQHGNTFGTCSIEILSTPDMGQHKWKGFMQDISDLWMSLQPEIQNSFRKAGLPAPYIRPHWAKQWQGLTFPDPSNPSGRRLKDIEYLKLAYREQIFDFKDRMSILAKRGGYSFEDMKERFSNDLLNELLD